MPTEYCPKCKASRNMIVAKSRAKSKSKEEKDITILSYHCEVCNTFVKSEESILDNLQRSKSLEDYLNH